MKCKDCKYYELLTNHPDSWGSCEWFRENEVKGPFWIPDVTEYGAIHPACNICKVGKPRSDA